jgi:hypothetical protein
MELVEQIKQICVETDNKWFLTHQFTKIALYDLELQENLEKENIITSVDSFHESECICLQENIQQKVCIRCTVEIERNDHFDELKLSKSQNCIYDYENEVYTKSKWIIPEKIDDEIPGFILIKCCGDGLEVEDEGFTHELVFACVRYKYRKNGILKNMVRKIPKEWNIWLEANSNDIENVENVWGKCGFSYHTTIHDEYLIYKRMGIN